VFPFVVVCLLTSSAFSINLNPSDSTASAAFTLFELISIYLRSLHQPKTKEDIFHTMSANTPESPPPPPPASAAVSSDDRQISDDSAAYFEDDGYGYDDFAVNNGKGGAGGTHVVHKKATDNHKKSQGQGMYSAKHVRAKEAQRQNHKANAK
jgi:hypothetical protein